MYFCIDEIEDHVYYFINAIMKNLMENNYLYLLFRK